VPRHVLTRQEARPIAATDRRRHERVVEQHAALGQAIEMRRPDVCVADRTRSRVERVSFAWERGAVQGAHYADAH
jgi:hypothetical protein